MSRLAIDPGVDTGFAVFDVKGALVDCGLSDRFPTFGISLAIIECPQVYPGRNSKGDPNDLIVLAVRVGRYQERLEAAGARVTLVLPRAWKGTVPKDIHNARVIRDLSPEAAAVVLEGCRGVVASKVNNIIDAIGLGSWAFRSGPWRVRP